MLLNRVRTVLQCWCAGVARTFAKRADHSAEQQSGWKAWTAALDRDCAVTGLAISISSSLAWRSRLCLRSKSTRSKRPLHRAQSFSCNISSCSLLSCDCNDTPMRCCTGKISMRIQRSAQAHACDKSFVSFDTDGAMSGIISSFMITHAVLHACQVVLQAIRSGYTAYAVLADRLLELFHVLRLLQSVGS